MAARRSIIGVDIAETGRGGDVKRTAAIAGSPSRRETQSALLLPHLMGAIAPLAGSDIAGWVAAEFFWRGPLFFCCAIVYVGCSVRDPGVHDAIPPSDPLVIGPSPLRRLTNREYLNALRDLFPGVSVDVPQLPSDNAVAGFENTAEAQDPSDVRIARTEEIANLYAEAATTCDGGVAALVGCVDVSSDDAAMRCGAQFVSSIGARVFRRPLSDGERDRLVASFDRWRTALDFDAAVQLTLSAMLQSPQFLYRPEPAPQARSGDPVVDVEPYAMASRLSFFLWERAPDDLLLQAALKNELHTEAQVREQAQRMVRDERARAVLWSFHRQWLGLDRILLDEHSGRTDEVDPHWNAKSQASASLELERFVTNVLSEGGTLRDLLTSRRAWINGEMARIYGVSAPPDPTTWLEVSLPPTERAGILTRASFLAAFAHRGATSPPVRGNGVQLRFLCELPTSPPPGVDLSQPKPAPGDGPQTNRMLFETRTKPEACQSCHAALNGFGFGFEHYSAAARYQTHENGLPIDARGVIYGTDVDAPFNGAIELSEALSRSVAVQKCATQQWVRYALGRLATTGEAALVADLGRQFLASGGDVRDLMVRIAASPSFRRREAEQ